MAFSKIAGFEVTPVRPSRLIRVASPPLATKSRARKSSHTAWPYSVRDLRGFIASVPWRFLPRQERPLGCFREGAERFRSAPGPKRRDASRHAAALVRLKTPPHHIR